MRQSLSCLENTEAEEFMEKWVVSAKKADFQQIANKFGIDPVVARLIRNREQITDEEIMERVSCTAVPVPTVRRVTFTPWASYNCRKASAVRRSVMVLIRNSELTALALLTVQ